MSSEGRGGAEGRPRWFTETSKDHSQWYVERFRSLAAEGADLAGEARFIDAVVPPGSAVLDAGCGTGRLAAALHSRGHEAVGVDVDPVLIEAAQQDRPGPAWVVADLVSLDLGRQFDAVVCAGNVMVFLAPGSEEQVVRNLAAHVAPGGVLVLGFRREPHVSPELVEAAATDAGLVQEQRFATWDLRPWHPDGEFTVMMLRRPDTSEAGPE